MNREPITADELYHQLFPETEPNELTAAEVIETTLQVDQGMFGQLPRHWQNPGMAGACAWQIVLQALRSKQPLCIPEVKQLIDKIPEQLRLANDELLQRGPEAFVKKFMTVLYESAGGFRRNPYTPDDSAPLLDAVAELPREGQLVYRKSDGRFFILIDDAYRQRLHEHAPDFVATTAAVRHAHITVNEGMRRDQSQGHYERLFTEYGLDRTPFYRGPSDDYVALACRPSFTLVGVYSGIPKTNPRVIESVHLQVQSDWLDAQRQQGLGPIYADYTYHTTYAERSRLLHSITRTDDLLQRGLPADTRLLHAINTITPPCVRFYTKEACNARLDGDDALARKHTKDGRVYLAQINTTDESIKIDLAASFDCEESYQAYFKGDLQSALTLAEQASRNIGTLSCSDDNHLRLAECALLQFKIKYRQESVSTAGGLLETCQEKLDLCQANGRRKSALQAECTIHRSRVRLYDGDYQTAEQLALDALAGLRELYQETHPEIAWAHRHCADVYEKQQKDPQTRKHLQAAIDIYEQLKTRGIAHPASVRCLLRLAKLVLKARDPKGALERLSEAEDILLAQDHHREDFLAAIYFTMGQSYHQQGKWRKAEKKYRLSLLLDERLHKPEHDHILATHSSLAKLYFDQQQFSRALDLAEQCLASLAPDLLNTTQYDMKLLSIRCQMALAHKKNEPTRLNRASDLLKELIAWQSRVFEPATANLRNETLLDLDRLLTLHAQCDVSRDPQAAAERYYQQAKQYQQITPIIAWRWLSAAIKHAKLSKSCLDLLGDCYAARGEVATGLGCHLLALRQFQKAEQLKRDVRQQQAACHKTIKDDAKLLGDELYSQFSSAHELFLSIQLEFLSAQSAGQALSARSCSRTLDCMIKIRSILDMSFRRLAVTIWDANQCRAQEIYFPYADTQAAFDAKLASSKLMGYLPSSSKLFKKLGKMGHSLKPVLNYLRDAGYIDDKKCATDKVNGPICLDDIDPMLWPLRDLISKVLRAFQPGDHTAKVLHHKFNPPVLPEPPTAQQITARLNQHGFLTIIDGIEYIDPIHLSTITRLRTLMNPSDPPELQAAWAAYTPRIFAMLKAQSHSQIHLRQPEFRRVLAKLRACQPYTYHNPGDGANQQTAQQPGNYWQKSWLEKLSLLQNLGKHFQPVQQTLDHQVDQCTEGLRHNQVRVLVPYTPSNFHPWCFAHLIDHPDKLALSARLVNWLEDIGLLARHQIQDPLLTKPSVLKQRTELLVARLTDQLEQHLGQSEPDLKTYLPIVAAHLVHRAQGKEEQLIDVVDLLGRSLCHAKEVVSAITTVCVKQTASKFDAIRAPRQEKAQKTTRLPAISFKSLSDLDRDTHHVSHNIRADLGRNKVNDVCSMLQERASKLRGPVAWLALRYYARAIEWVCYSQLEDDVVTRLLKAACAAAHTLGYNNMAQVWCKRVEHWAYRQQRQISLPDAFVTHSQITSVTTQLDGQLDYIAESLADLRYQIFKLYCDPSHHIQLHRVQNQVVSLIISGRHLLDNLLGYFINDILHPNHQAKTIQIAFPCMNSEKDLKDKLLGYASARLAGKLTTDNYPLWNNPKYMPAYHAIRACQPFSYLDGKHCWLERMQTISNKFKHERVHFPDGSELEQRKLIIDSIGDFYTIPNPAYSDGKKQIAMLPLLESCLRELRQLHRIFSATAPAPQVLSFKDDKGKAEADDSESDDEDNSMRL